eukprot:CAMPEP_0174304370 /NCGR_PEP_ID=MMETSP0809-20121228/60749_1 /TAXON_ID=73025 ORGANISM="Eutreptiella gymnastica-like, Strain CCMP1594" /NCGR_SAMPLE_ID=MMETSP0809 /ASSEMBLY_ACC=CAM_ASM_000658 /LENGTH=180 /DNA_ID=CAMNT_0015410591 /DNA_START=17 /DNA_END=559 /DNA_ORIENTATION=-
MASFGLQCLFVGVFFMDFVHALDVSWIPADPDGNLPLSTNYRDSLRKLCHKFDRGDFLSHLPHQKKATVVKLCLKLKEDDAHDGGHGSSSRGVGPIIIVGLLSLAFCVFRSPKNQQYFQRGTDNVKRQISGWWVRSTGSQRSLGVDTGPSQDCTAGARSVDSAQALSETRAARLRRFEQQ